ncbi:pilus assembly protein TadG-related protein [Asticcacaulis sp. EMRT-3]|uniref:vWA domain-containing protein n=1 Tax=Asticcacaulis sp. EMRT-3 TaxID=3040349 RepID=UPI0024AFECC0|nr:pilus assembly protein TadG-related protein [Asticcacaulis sp. EMRT-3]MDI7775043.1 VWA domain-containing protein [Asticcacaulis sp. EMRT-3]
MTSLSQFFRRFRLNAGGNVTIIVALSILPVATAVGGSIDLASALNARAHLQDAADSAAIAAALDTTGTLATQQAAALTAFCGNIADSTGKGSLNTMCNSVVAPGLDQASGSLAISTNGNVQTMNYSATAQVPTVMLDLIGMKTLSVNVVSHAGVTMNAAEIAFVLDNTGSMAQDNKMTELRSSVKSVLATLLDSSGQNSGKTRVAIVPFDTQVALSNVSSMVNYATDFGAVTPVFTCNGQASASCTALVANYSDMCNGDANCLNHMVNYTTTYTSGYGYNRTTYYAVLSSSYQTSNTTYQTGYRNQTTRNYIYRHYEVTTYSVASDGSLSKVSSYSNGDNYTSNGYIYPPNAYYYGWKQFTATVASTTPSGGGYNSGSSVVYMDNNTIESTDNLMGVSTGNWSGCVIDRTQPYDTQADAPVSSNSATLYPAAKCATPSLLPIMDLTTDIAGASAYADKMQPAGNTNITIGVQWGMEVLSPTAPFTTGAAFTDPTINKYMILLTDGENTQNRWTTNASQIDARTALACKNAKALGITIFTVRLEDGNSDMLSQCASQTGYYYNLSSSNQINGALGGIMKSIKKIRLTQ